MHANRSHSMEIKCMEGGGELHISAAIYFRYWGAGHIQENPKVV